MAHAELTCTDAGVAVRFTRRGWLHPAWATTVLLPWPDVIAVRHEGSVVRVSTLSNVAKPGREPWRSHVIHRYTTADDATAAAFCTEAASRL
jgi:hypothetical protein